MYGRWALIMASATPYTYLPDKIPNHRKNEAFDDPACPPEWPKVADTMIEAIAATDPKAPIYCYLISRQRLTML